LYTGTIEEIKENYRTEMLKYYYSDSRLDHFTTITSSQEILDSLKLAKYINIPKDTLDGNVYLVTSSIVQSITMGEYRYAVNNINSIEENIIISETSPNKEIINEAIVKSMNYSIPDFIIIPVEFFVDIHKWGMPITNKKHYSTIFYEDNMPFYRFGSYNLKILWTNKYIDFNNIIIGSKHNSMWIYKPDKPTGERLTIKFERTPQKDTLLLQTVFKFHPPNPDTVTIIKFTKNAFDQLENGGVKD